MAKESCVGLPTITSRSSAESSPVAQSTGVASSRGRGVGNAGARSRALAWPGVSMAYCPVSTMVPFSAYLLARPKLASFPAIVVRDRHLVIQNPEKPWGEQVLGLLEPAVESSGSTASQAVEIDSPPFPNGRLRIGRRGRSPFAFLWPGAESSFGPCERLRAHGKPKEIPRGPKGKHLGLDPGPEVSRRVIGQINCVAFSRLIQWMLHDLEYPLKPCNGAQQ